MNAETRKRFYQLCWVQLKIGCTGFGGPLAVMSMMRDELVDRTQLISPERYLEGLGVVKLLPGPVSTLLAVFLGQEIAGPIGGLASGLIYIFPSFMLMLGIAYFETALASLFTSPTFRFVLQTLQAAVIGVILYACVHLFQDALKKKYLERTQPIWTWVFALMAIILAIARVPEIAVLGLCSFLSWAVFTKRIQKNIPRLQVSPVTIFFTFFYAGLTVFGTGYMVLPYLQRVLVEQQAWITNSQFLDGVTYGNLTPGPVLVASTYFGFKIAGLSGALIASAGMFGGPIVLMLTLGPTFRKFLGRPWVEGVLLGLLPAVAATIAVSLISLGRSIDWSPFSVGLAVIGFVALVRFRAPSWAVLLASGLCAFVYAKFVL